MTRQDILLGCFLLVAMLVCGRPGLAGDEAGSQGMPAEVGLEDAESLLSPDRLISRDDWKRRLLDARKRADQARADWKQNAPQRPLIPPDPPEKIATERVLSDDTLRPGDIVSTDKGLMLFRGRSAADGQTADLVPLNPR